MVDLKEQLDQISAEIKALETYAFDYECFGCDEESNCAKACIRKLNAEEKKVRWEMKNLPKPELNLIGENNNNCVYYYQGNVTLVFYTFVAIVVDGNNVYLHSLNWKCVKEDFGDDLPPEVSGKVVEVDTCTMDEDLRRKFRYLKHLPLGRVFHIVEIDIESPAISQETLTKFGEDISRRLQKRLLRKEIEFELDIAKKRTEDSYNQFRMFKLFVMLFSRYCVQITCLDFMGSGVSNDSIIVGSVKMESGHFSPEDFVPLAKSVGSSSLTNRPTSVSSYFFRISYCSAFIIQMMVLILPWN